MDYELADVSVSGHVALAQEAKRALGEISERLRALDAAAALGAETGEEAASRAAKTEALSVRRRDAELRLAYLEVKLRERLGSIGGK